VARRIDNHSTTGSGTGHDLRSLVPQSHSSKKRAGEIGRTQSARKFIAHFARHDGTALASAGAYLPEP
jgi:hypothetical protein